MMPHKQKHRGPHTKDDRNFSNKYLNSLREAVKDYSYFLTRDYSRDAALKTVGDHYQLNDRQRLAVMRNSCQDQSLAYRKYRCIVPEKAGQNPLHIDCFNLLITIESALSGGYIFEGRDGCYRDLASVHSSYKRVEETLPALTVIGKALEKLAVKKVYWYIDQPVSNSGRLKGLLMDLALDNNWHWEAALFPNPDHELVQQNRIVTSSDSHVLDRCYLWVNLAKWIIDRFVTSPRVMKLG